MEPRFDNLTDKEIEEGMTDYSGDLRKKKRRNAWIIAIFFILILVVGYEIAPLASPEAGKWYLEWFRG